jgi:hypothetical protein
VKGRGNFPEDALWLLVFGLAVIGAATAFGVAVIEAVGR